MAISKIEEELVQRRILGEQMATLLFEMSRRDCDLAEDVSKAQLRKLCAQWDKIQKASE